MRVRLRHDRLARHLAGSRSSQNAWAQRLRLSRGHLSDLVRGNHPYPSSRTRQKLLEGLDLGFEDLFEIEEGKSPSKNGENRQAAPAAKRGLVLPPLIGGPASLLFHLAFAALLVALSAGVWQVLDHHYLAPRSHPDSQSRIVIRERQGNRIGPSPSWPNFNDIRDRSRLLASVAAYTKPSQIPVRDELEPAALTGTVVTSDFFDTFRVSPLLGELPATAHGSETMPVAISFDLWRDRYGSDPAAVGYRLEVGGLPATVTAILPAGFTRPGRTEVWIPHSFLTAGAGGRQSHNFEEVIARLEPEADWDSVALELDAIAQRLATLHPELGPDFGLEPFSLHEFLGLRLERDATLVAWLTVVLLSLGLLTAALSAERRALPLLSRESGPKGRSSAELRASLAWEGILIAIGAALLGAAAGSWLAEALASAWEIPSVAAGGALSVRRLAIIIVVSTAMGLLPAFYAGRRLRVALESPPSAARPRLGRVLTVLFMSTASFALLGLALTFGAQWITLAKADLGFDPSPLIEVRLNLAGAGEESSRDRRGIYAFHQALLEQVRASDRIEAASFALSPPLSDAVKIDSDMSRVGPGSRESLPGIDFRVVGPGFFRTLGLRRIAGRVFEDSDQAGRTPVAVVNESLAALLGNAGEVIGTRVEVPGQAVEPAPGRRPLEIVGVIADLRHRDPRIAPRPALYVPYAQHPVRAPYMRLLARAASAPREVAALVGQIVYEANPELPASRPRLLGDLIDRRIRPARFRALVAILGAVLALLMTVRGLRLLNRLRVLPLPAEPALSPPLE